MKTTPPKLNRLNIPYVSTILIDYCWMASIVFIAYILAADEKCNALTVGLSTLYVPVVNVSREQIYWLINPLRKGFSETKTRWRFWDYAQYLADVFVTTSIIVMGTAASAYFGSIHCSFFQKSDGNSSMSDIRILLSSLMIISRDYWIVNILKDNITMRFIHPWMHKKENYWLHKRHHQGNKNCNIWHAFVIDVVDLIIEFQIGAVIGLVANYLLFGDPSLHLLSVLFSIWTDANLHSENPYSQVIGNPILDLVFKPNICHNLHHVVQTDPKYMVVWPIHHLKAGERDADVAKYNMVMNTKVDFRIFL